MSIRYYGCRVVIDGALKVRYSIAYRLEHAEGVGARGVALGSGEAKFDREWVVQTNYEICLHLCTRCLQTTDLDLS